MLLLEKRKWVLIENNKIEITFIAPQLEHLGVPAGKWQANRRMQIHINVKYERKSAKRGSAVRECLQWRKK